MSFSRLSLPLGSYLRNLFCSFLAQPGKLEVWCGVMIYARTKFIYAVLLLVVPFFIDGTQATRRVRTVGVELAGVHLISFYPRVAL